MLNHALVFCVLLLASFSLNAEPTPANPPKPGGTGASTNSINVLEVDSSSNSIDLKNVAQPRIAIPLTFEQTALDKATLIIRATKFISTSNGETYATDLADSPGALVTTHAETVQKEPEITRSQTKLFYLAAELDYAGDYKASLSASIKEKPEIPPLKLAVKVNRTLAKPQLQIDAPAILQIENSSWCRADPIQLESKITSQLKELNLNPPQLIDPMRYDKVDSRAGVAAPIKLVGEAGKEQAIPLIPNTPKSIKLGLVDVPGAGRYEMKLRFAAAGYEPIDKDIKIYVRNPAWLALLLVGLGVVLSFCIHAYGAARPGLLLQQRLALLRERLAEAAQAANKDPDAAELIAAVNRAMQKKWERARSGGGDLMASIDVYDDIIETLPKWTALHGQILAVRPPSVRDELLPTLENARQAFILDTPDSAAVQTAIQSIQMFPKTLRAKVQQALIGEIGKLQNRLGKDNRPAIVALNNRLGPVLEKAEKGEIETVLQDYDAVYLGYIEILRADLRARVQAPDGQALPHPPGLAEADWRTLATDTIAQLDQINRDLKPEEAMNRLVLAATSYLNAYAAALERAVKTQLPRDVETPNILADLAAMKKDLEAKDFQAAWVKLDEAVKRYIEAATRGTGAQMGYEAFVSAAPAVFDIIETFKLPAWESFGGQGSAARIGQRIETLDYVISAIVLVVTCVVIFQGVWIDNPTWGGWPSLLAAFLAGFMADTFTHAGVKALANR